MCPEEIYKQSLDSVLSACVDKHWSKSDIARLVRTALKEGKRTRYAARQPITTCIPMEQTHEDCLSPV